MRILLVLCLLLCACTDEVVIPTQVYIPKKFSAASLEVPYLGVSMTLEGVNNYVNSRTYHSDLNLYGEEDYWATPQEFLVNGGDCEDFAVAKYYILIRQGQPVESMHLLLVWGSNTAKHHVILLVGDKVLDNQDKEIKKYKYVQYGLVNISSVRP